MGKLESDPLDVDGNHIQRMAQIKRANIDMIGGLDLLIRRLNENLYNKMPTEENQRHPIDHPKGGGKSRISHPKARKSENSLGR